MKKIISVLLVMVLMLGLVSCGGSKVDTPVKSGDRFLSEEDYLNSIIVMDEIYVIENAVNVNYLYGISYDEEIISEIIADASDVDVAVTGEYNIVFTVVPVEGDSFGFSQIVNVVDVETAKELLSKGLTVLGSDGKVVTQEDITAIRYDKWMKDHGINITPQGSFVYKTTIKDENNLTVGEVDLPCRATVSETTEGCEPGFKRVSCEFVSDMNPAGGYYSNFWHSAFDRYSGISFEFDAIGDTLNMGQQKSKDGNVIIDNGEGEFEIGVTFDSRNNDPEWITVVSVTCPVDYDGVVFYNGYASEELSQENMNYDYSSRLYTIDELPYFGGDRYYYFSYTND